ncbi:S9 family peptidase [Ruicaihuangia caeni]|uniref:S9 family peptidase n=1 Tax=Ruicaihuangia caeni TaxID=3042517 RepID=A0AAW6TA44_9MICO|nr:S9 family peptidase [Klugiella sp. YN-L-19]MDI2098205.1 S9 family peptidase [Klugiella sp. YN-L-19]
MRADELPLLKSISRPSVHPGGDRAIVSATYPHLGADAYVGQLWEVALSGRARQRRITRGFRDTDPQFSPDGTMVAFLRSTAAGEHPQVWLMDAVGGEPRPLTDAALGVIEFRWSPDSKRIAFRAFDPEEGRYGTIDGLPPSAEPARHITRRRYRADGVGFVSDRFMRLFVLDVPALNDEPVYPVAPGVRDPKPKHPTAVPDARRLTTGEYHFTAFCFGSDSESIVAVAARHESRDDDLRTDLWRIALNRRSVTPRLLTGDEPPRAISLVEHAPGGALFFLAQELGHTARDFVARNTGLYRFDGASPALRLTDAESVDLQAASGMTVLDDNRVLVHELTRGTVQLRLVEHREGDRAATTSVAPLTSGAVVVNGSQALAEGRGIALTLAAGHTYGDLVVLRDGGYDLRTDFSAPLRRAGIRRALELEVASSDGYPVHGWVVLPEGEGPHPVLLNIHGGPYASYLHSLFDEAQVYASAGYAVVMCNPRGSAGYGQRHGRSIRHAMGTVDMQDVLAFLDGALDRHRTLDRGRVGIMGGSYGGYLTAWITSHEHRFEAAIVERGFLDATAFAGNSDIGTFFGQEYLGTDRTLVAAQNPQDRAHLVKTPTLIMHSEDDLRCPVDQAERYYQALREHGTDAELVLFPGENHELSRTGRPRHRLQRFELILNWWRRHLPTDENRTGIIQLPMFPPHR